jgi:hypothetical protein
VLKLKNAKTILLILLTTALTLSSLFASPAFAQEDDDPAAFVIAQNGVYVGASGWYAGYVVAGQSGTYILNISATGSPSQYPITDIKIIALISDAAHDGQLTALSINGMPLTAFTEGDPAYYGANGGPFSEPDYYGYNDQYTITQLTYQQVHHPTNWYQLPVTVTFAENATMDAKVMFLLYGTDAKGLPVKTPFSEATLFVLPEYVNPILALAAFAAAYLVYRKKSTLKQKLLM